MLSGSSPKNKAVKNRRDAECSRLLRNAEVCVGHDEG